MNIGRGVEFFVALILLIFLLPVFFIVALSIKLSSKGSIFFSSPRIGLRGKQFSCFKFRTMHTHPEKFLKNFFEKHPEKREEWETFHKLQDDPRVYALGKFLRKSSLDELPQLFNVLLGTMSLIGPRPLLDTDLAQIPQHLKNKFLSIKPGITGMWQVSGRNTICFAQRIAIESQYIDQKNLFLDIKILFKTIPAVLFKKGAF